MAKESVRRRLTEVALALFEERGYDQTTVDDITARAGVGRTTFFRAFGSKEDVLFPHHDEVLVTVRDRLDAATPPTAELAVVEAARLVLRHYLDEGDVARARYRLTSSVPPLRHREIAGMQHYQRAFRDFVADRFTPPMTDLRAELLAGAVVTATNYVLRRWLRGLTDRPEPEFDAAIAEALGIHRPAGAPAEHEDDEGTAVLVFRSRRDLDSVVPALQALLGTAPDAP